MAWRAGIALGGACQAGLSTAGGSYVMPKRKTDPETGEPILTYRENKFVDGYIAAGGNATRAAIQAGYSPNYADRAGSNVLARPHPLVAAAPPSTNALASWALRPSRGLLRSEHPSAQPM